MPDLGAVLGGRKRDGVCSFVPYVTGGLSGVDAHLLHALEGAGADAIEVGIPFSDPVMDGPVIQEASRRAIEVGAGPSSVLGTVRQARLGVPVAVMTYANPVCHAGHASFLAACVDAGVSGVIVPDLPVDEAADWVAACAEASVSTVFIAAPDTPDARLRAIADASGGFLYCVATYGVTGARDRLPETALELTRRLRPVTDLPLLIGVGITDPAQAAQARAFADGVVVGSALVQPLLEGDRSRTLGLARAFAAAVHGT